MSISEIKKTLLRAVAEELENSSFRFHAARQSYERQTDCGRVSLHLAFINHVGDFDVTADVAVRFDGLENLLNAYRPHLSTKEKKNTFSMGCELGNLIEGRQRRWKVRSEADIAPVVASILETFRVHGEPYLEKYSNLEKAYAVLAADEETVARHVPFRHKRALTAVGLAKILGKPDLFDLIETHKELLAGEKGPGMANFLKFVEAEVPEYEGSKAGA